MGGYQENQGVWTNGTTIRVISSAKNQGLCLADPVRSEGTGGRGPGGGIGHGGLIPYGAIIPEEKSLRGSLENEHNKLTAAQQRQHSTPQL